MKTDLLVAQNTRMTVEIAELGRELGEATAYGARRTHQLNDAIRELTAARSELEMARIELKAWRKRFPNHEYSVALDCVCREEVL